MTSKLCYITGFLDIGRKDWNEFQRSFEDYFSSFTPLADMFNKMTDSNKSYYHLVVFIDKKCSRYVKEYLQAKNITVIEIDEDFLTANIPAWSRLAREQEIMNSDKFKNLMSSVGRLRFPEHSNPKYTLINHAKIDFVNYAMNLESLKECPYFCWVDFGYFAKPDRIPQFPLDITRFNLSTVNYTLINPLTSKDKDVFYTLTHAPERIGGFFFFGNRKSLIAYQKLFHAIHKAFQTVEIADDDQHIALQCYFKCPELFTLHNLGGWHRALTEFQCSSDTVKPNLTEIMNRHGSDKGSGHHNYTEYYSVLFDSIREEKMNILEIGIGTNNPSIPSSMCGTPGGYVSGASLRGWEEYFLNSQIYGCDIDRDILFEKGCISTFFLDQTNPEVIQKEIIDCERMYDIIIDDGLHHFHTNWNLLKLIFCKLNRGGIYVIEDIRDFDTGVYSDPFLEKIEFRYVVVPNPKNPADNNIVVARWKGEKIPELNRIN